MIKPLQNYVVAQLQVAETTTKSGLHIPPNAENQSEIAIVRAVGREVEEVNVGDKIVYSGSRKVKIDNKEYMIIKGEDVLATIKETK
jgi:chaperonin GroES